MACVYQKVSDLKACSRHLDEVIKLIDTQEPSNKVSEFNKIRYNTKFQLQQCAIKSQIGNHSDALVHGKAAVKNCHLLIFKSYKLCKKKLDEEYQKKNDKRMRLSNKKQLSEKEETVNEYGVKKMPSKSRNFKIDKSKYFQTHDPVKDSGRKRRCHSEESSQNNSVNLSTRKIVLNRHRADSRDSSLENVHTFHLKHVSSERTLLKSQSNASLVSERLGNLVRKIDSIGSDTEGA